ncbi:hypothetical protein GmHk_07G019641 [Glycine max]|nr:hypothetical protein GmHk_07G019641 [Glycine max]
MDMDEISELKNMGTQRILVSDHTNGYQYSTEEVDSIVIDMDSFSSGINKDITKANFRIITSETLIKVTKTLDLRSCTAEKSMVVTVGSTHHSTNTQVHHHITIIASNMSTTTTLKESKYVASKICVLSFFFLVFRAGNKMMMRMVHLPVKAPQGSENIPLQCDIEQFYETRYRICALKWHLDHHHGSFKVIVEEKFKHASIED